MDELIERLGRPVSDGFPIVIEVDGAIYDPLRREAATALRALADENRRYKEALEKIAFGPPHEGEVKQVLNELVEIAQFALERAAK